MWTKLKGKEKKGGKKRIDEVGDGEEKKEKKVKNFGA